MDTQPLKLVTVVAESILEHRLLDMLRDKGARGYTLTKVTGQGSRGVRASEWEGRNIKIETLVGPQVADTILEHLARRFFPHYAVVAYVQTVEVVRGEKYVGGGDAAGAVASAAGEGEGGETGPGDGIE